MIYVVYAIYVRKFNEGFDPKESTYICGINSTVCVLNLKNID